jgi:hypothetical protein
MNAIDANQNGPFGWRNSLADMCRRWLATRYQVQRGRGMRVSSAFGEGIVNEAVSLFRVLDLRNFDLENLFAGWSLAGQEKCFDPFPFAADDQFRKSLEPPGMGNFWLGVHPPQDKA